MYTEEKLTRAAVEQIHDDVRDALNLIAYRWQIKLEIVSGDDTPELGLEIDEAIDSMTNALEDLLNFELSIKNKE